MTTTKKTTSTRTPKKTTARKTATSASVSKAAPKSPAAPAKAVAVKAAPKRAAVKPAAPLVVEDSVPTPVGPELKKPELIDLVVKRSGIKKKDAKPVVEAMLEVLGEAMRESRELNLEPYGKARVNRVKQLSGARVSVVKFRQKTANAAEAGNGSETEDAPKAETPLAPAAE